MLDKNLSDKEKIIQFLDIKGITKNKFYSETGFSNGFLDSGSSLGVDKLRRILDIYRDFNAEWLITGVGSPVKSRVSDLTTAREPIASYELKTDHSIGMQSIPLYNIEASAGLVELFRHHNDEKAVDTISIPNLPKCDGAVYVTGDSMYPLLKSGDIVMYKEIHNIVDGLFWGEMYLVSVDLDGEEYISVKYIQKSEKGEAYIKLVSQNSHHQPKDVKLKTVRALALIKASIRINSMN